MCELIDIEQRKRAVNPYISVAALSPAGGGKTHSVVERFLNVLALSERPEDVVAITFTNMAAAEIRARVESAIRSAIAGDESDPMLDSAKKVLDANAQRGWGLTAELGSLRIMTFDTFAASIAHRLPILSGKRLTVESTPSLLYREAILRTMALVEKDDCPLELKKCVEHMLALSKNRLDLLFTPMEQLLAKRDQWIDSLSIEVGEPVRAMAHEYSKDVVRLLSDDVIQPLVRFVAEGKGFGDPFCTTTDVACALACLKEVANTVLTGKGQLKKKLTKREGFPAGEEKTKHANALLSVFENEHRLLCAKGLVMATMIPSDLDSDVEQNQHMAIFLRYLLANLNVVFNETGKCDFSHIGLSALKALRSCDGGAGDALLAEDRVCHFIVDEMQDTSPLQIKLLLEICEEWGDEDSGRTVGFFGDVNQSIYRFRGAVPGLFQDIVKKQSFAHRKIEVLNYQTNFRTLQGGVDWLNLMFDTRRISNNLSVPKIEAARKEPGGSVTFLTSQVEDNRLLPSVLVNQVQKLKASNPGGKIALLAQARSHFEPYVKELVECGITVCGHDLVKLADTAHVGDVISIFNAIRHKADRLAWVGLLRSSLVGMCWRDIDSLLRGENVLPYKAVMQREYHENLGEDGRARVRRLSAVLQSLCGHPKGRNMHWALKAVWESLGGRDTVSSDQYSDVLKTFSLVGEHCPNGGLVDEDAFKLELERLYSSSSSGDVTLMTAHKAKGLEFEHVFVVGLENSKVVSQKPLLSWRYDVTGFLMGVKTKEEGIYHLLRNFEKEDDEKERWRLMYVAFTRFKNDLYVLYPADSGFNQSALLAKIDPEIVEGSIQKLDVHPLSRSSDNAQEDIPVTRALPGTYMAPKHFNDNKTIRREISTPKGLRSMIGYKSIVSAVEPEGMRRKVLALSLFRGDTTATSFIKGRLRQAGVPVVEERAAETHIMSLREKVMSSEIGQWVEKGEAVPCVDVVGVRLDGRGTFSPDIKVSVGSKTLLICLVGESIGLCGAGLFANGAVEGARTSGSALGVNIIVAQYNVDTNQLMYESMTSGKNAA